MERRRCASCIAPNEAAILVSGHSHNVLVDANTITSSPVGADAWGKDAAAGHLKNVLILNGTR